MKIPGEMTKKNNTSFKQLLLITIVVLLLFYYNVSTSGANNNAKVKHPDNSKRNVHFEVTRHLLQNKTSKNRYKLIVSATKWFGQHDKSYEKYLKDCNKKCVHSIDPSLIPKADAVLFHYWPTEGNFYDPSIHRRSEIQRFIAYSKESPMTLRSVFSQYNETFSSHFFNWTMSYRRRKNVSLLPYGMIVNGSSAIKQRQLGRLISQKTKTAIFIASNCNAFSKREDIVHKLSMNKNLSVDIWGKCGQQNHCSNDEREICEKKIESEYFFNLAFENSICVDYVTEKLWKRAVKFRTVPVVLNRKITENVGFPGDGFIAVDDFTSIAELGKFLLKLQTNLTEYEKYFKWQSHYQITDDGNQFAWCDLCERLWDDTEPPAVIADVKQIFQNIAECIEPIWK